MEIKKTFKRDMEKIKIVKCDCGGRINIFTQSGKTLEAGHIILMCLDCKSIVAKLPAKDYLEMLEKYLPGDGEDNLQLVEVEL